MKYKISFFITLFLLSLSGSAQIQKQFNSAEIIHKLQKLNTVGSVLYIAAHPDDENTRLISYLSNELKLRTGYLSLTRGDGGQNLIGKEQGDGLGLIRTQELLAARKTDGGEQFFTRAIDFGFSKNPEETLTIWNKDSVLADVVWVIRKFKPDVIICRFPTTGEGGHGHHTASAILAEEAFDKAADPNAFPEQLKYTSIWKTNSLYWNTFNFGGNNTTSEDQLKVDVGLYNPLLGKYYGEIAAESRSMHKSQGFGSAKVRGSLMEYFKPIKGNTSKTNLFENIPTTWNRFEETKKLNTLITKCIANFNPAAPQNSIKELITIYQFLNNLNTSSPLLSTWRTVKLKEAKDILLACAGFWAESYTSDYIGVPGDSIKITSQIISEYQTGIKVNSVTYLGTEMKVNKELKLNELYLLNNQQLISRSLPFSNPYWLNKEGKDGLYNVSNPLLIGNPENNSSTTVTYHITFNGINFDIEQPLIYKYTDPVKGEIYRPFEILPPATVTMEDKVLVFTTDVSRSINFIIKANADNTKGTLQITPPSGWNISIKNPEFSLAKKGDEIIISAGLTPAAVSSSGTLSASLLIGGNSYGKSIQRINYDHIPAQFILKDATIKVVKFHLNKEGKEIGYIPGAGDEVSACLSQIGYNVTILTDELLTYSDLSKFDAIVTGVRAHNTNERLRIHYDKLMDYVKNGGNLIVQYNTNNRIGPVISPMGPYPFNISRDRVTNEKAEVRFLAPNSPVLNYPNKITEADFNDWVQERCIYSAVDLDNHYTKILSLNDPNEKNNEGSLIVTNYGKGNFVYTGLVFFRQLPAGNPGAYKLFVNLLSLPENK